MKTGFLAVMAAVVAAAWAGTASRAEEPKPDIEPRAERELRAACDYLAQSPFFVVKAELWRERVTASGEKLQFTRLYDLDVRKPDRLHADIRGTVSHREFWFDGKRLSVLDKRRNLYSSAEIGGSIEKAADTAQKDYGIDIPLIDLAVKNPYESTTARVQHGRYLGTAPVLGVECQHLAFTQENIDWQVWIVAGARPLIRKIVITHKLEPGQPQFTALLTDWDLNSRIADSDFTFEPPPGAAGIPMQKVSEMLSRKVEETPASGQK